MQYHHYSLTELESMLPWERATYVALVSKHVKEENERIQKQNEKIAAENQRRKRRR
jgi:ribosomal protein L44E